jgi:hypothetical protein
MPKLVVGVMHINGVQGGRSERYFFQGSGGQNPSNYVATMKNIVWGRSAFFGVGVKCVYARVSSVGKPPDKKTVDMLYPVGPHPSWTGSGGTLDVNSPVNDDNVAVQQCFEFQDGGWSNHYYNFFPDVWIAGMALAAPGVLAYLQASSTVPSDLSPASGLNHLQTCQGYWAYVKANCVGATRVTSIDFTERVVSAIIFRNVTRHNVGRPFGLHRGRRPAALVS